MTSDPAVGQELEHAILCGDCRRVRSLLDGDPSLLDARFPDNLNLTPLMWACRNRRGSIVAELIGRGADVSLTNRLDAGGDGDGGNTALWFTGQGPSAGTTDVAARLLAAGADVDRRCEHGQTAIHVAAAWVHLDLVQLLVEAGGDATIPDEDGRTPADGLRQALAWCERRAELNPDQGRVVERAPRLIAYLATAETR